MATLIEPFTTETDTQHRALSDRPKGKIHPHDPRRPRAERNAAVSPRTASTPEAARNPSRTNTL